jgi:hypothetical protein
MHSDDVVVVRTVVNRQSRQGRPESLRRSDVVVRGGVEPPTFRFSGGRSYQLSYLTSVPRWARRSSGDCRGRPADRSGPDGI